MRYYADTERLDRWIADPLVGIAAVVREAERLCLREQGASTYYREHPELLYDGHPWLAFVDSGSAAYLGWAGR